MANKRTKRRFRQQNVQLDMRGNIKTTLAVISILIVMASVTLLGFVWLRSGTEHWKKALSERQREYEVTLKKRDNLRAELETFRSGKYILSAVHHWNLDLHPPYPGQVRRVSLNRESQQEDGPLDESLVVDRGSP